MAIRRIRSVYLVKFFTVFGRFVGGTKISFEEPLQKNIEAYACRWIELNPASKVQNFTADFLGTVDETGKN